MMYCKPMGTPMTKKIRKVRDSDSNPLDPSLYQKVIGLLMSLMNSQQYIFFAVNILSQFQVEPRNEHWIVAKHVLRYIHGMLNYGLRYTSTNDVQLHGFIYSYWEGRAEDKRSTSGMIFNWGSGMISQASKKQESTTLNTVEVEYIATCEECTKVVWLRKLIFGLFDQVPYLTVIYYDS